MKNISFTRIKQLWIHKTIYSRKDLLFSTLGLLAAMSMVTFGTSRYIDFLSSAYYMMFCLFMSLSLSSAFKSLQTKEGRIAFLTLPASPAEKFFASTVWAVVTPIVIFSLSAILIDLLHLLLANLTDTAGNAPHGMLLQLMLRQFSSAEIRFGAYSTSSLLTWIMFHVFSFSLFLLGACIWYKQVFLKTIAAIGICTFLLLLLSIYGFRLIHSLTISFNLKDGMTIGGMPAIITAITAFWTIATIIIWWISYRLFLRREAISQKWNLSGWLKK